MLKVGNQDRVITADFTDGTDGTDETTGLRDYWTTGLPDDKTKRKILTAKYAEYAEKWNSSRISRIPRSFHLLPLPHVPGARSAPLSLRRWVRWKRDQRRLTSAATSAEKWNSSACTGSPLISAFQHFSFSSSLSPLPPSYGSISHSWYASHGIAFRRRKQNGAPQRACSHHSGSCTTQAIPRLQA